MTMTMMRKEDYLSHLQEAAQCFGAAHEVPRGEARIEALLLANYHATMAIAVTHFDQAYDGVTRWEPV